MTSNFPARALLLFLALVVAPIGASQAQILSTPSAALRDRPIVSRYRAPQRLCFWREHNGSSFGVSGYCAVNDPHAYPGLGCSCEQTIEHRHIEHWGVVIDVDRGDENTSLH